VDAAGSHETSVNSLQIVQRHIPEYSNLLFCPVFSGKHHANKTLHSQKQSMAYQIDGFPTAARHKTADSNGHMTHHTPTELFQRTLLSLFTDESER
jgi:hypothetical protein